MDEKQRKKKYLTNMERQPVYIHHANFKFIESGKNPADKEELIQQIKQGYEFIVKQADGFQYNIELDEDDNFVLKLRS